MDGRLSEVASRKVPLFLVLCVLSSSSCCLKRRRRRRRCSRIGPFAHTLQFAERDSPQTSTSLRARTRENYGISA